MLTDGRLLQLATLRTRPQESSGTERPPRPVSGWASRGQRTAIEAYTEIAARAVSGHRGPQMSQPQRRQKSVARVRILPGRSVPLRDDMVLWLRSMMTLRASTSAQILARMQHGQLLIFVVNVH